jgi:hypothetical protein
VAVKIVSLTQGDGWYYVGPEVEGLPIVYKVAAWGVTEDGQVHGLISVTITENAPPHLVLPPPVGGRYKPEESLTDVERQSGARPG